MASQGQLAPLFMECEASEVPVAYVSESPQTGEKLYVLLVQGRAGTAICTHLTEAFGKPIVEITTTN